MSQEAREQLNNPDMIDKVISAKIPDPETHPRLYHLVTTMMVHHPCGETNPRAPCMKDGKCSKHYPKDLMKQLQWQEMGILFTIIETMAELQL